MDAVRGILTGLIVFITALGVLNTMMMSVLERVPEIGVLRSMGMGRAGVAKLFFTEALIIALFGGGIGVGLGSAVALWMERLGLDLGDAVAGSETLSVNAVLHPDWTPQLALLGIGLACIMAILGSAWPVLTALRVSPVEAIRRGL